MNRRHMNRRRTARTRTVIQASRSAALATALVGTALAAATSLTGCEKKTGQSSSDPPPEPLRTETAERAQDAPRAASADIDVDASALSFAVSFRSGPYTLRGDVVKPAGIGPFPTLVYNHGSELDPSREFTRELAEWFRSRGFVVFFPGRSAPRGCRFCRRVGDVEVVSSLADADEERRRGGEGADFLRPSRKRFQYGAESRAGWRDGSRG